MKICSHQHCRLDTYHNGDKCILHSDKKDKDIEFFWREIRRQVEKQNNPKSLLDMYVYFDNVYFPKFEEKGLVESSNHGRNFFVQDNNFNKIFKLINCTFWESADLSYIKFYNGIIFDSCIFENGLIIN